MNGRGLTHSNARITQEKKAVDCMKLSTSLALQFLIESVRSVMVCNMVILDLWETRVE